MSEALARAHLRADFMIGGRWVEAVDGRRVKIKDPATGEVIGDAAFGAAEDASRALAAAAQAFPAWSATPAEERARILRRGADLIRQRRHEIASALTREQGKPLADSLKEIDFGAQVFDFYAGLVTCRSDDWRPSSAPDIRSLVVRQPIGVVVAITPWNYPVDLFAWKAAPALAAGCTVVCKPAPQTPLATAQAVACLANAGLPPGVLNYVLGPNDTVGETLITDPRSRMIALTGSTATGRRVMALAAAGIKRLNLELGGQTPLIVLDDADLGATVPAAIRRSYSNMGQICIAVNRIYVSQGVADEFTDRFVQTASSLRLGHGLDPHVEYGPLIDETQVARVQEHVDDALSRGAHLPWGRTRGSVRL